ncbi:hypothetical protein OG455_14175 [Kitasatospora sp. NBC_01287]|uniref:hypothetical protein n=1 Tax=Kitasatospora sp. NBC_01287 TaxID=2903573 RepID=UPI00225AB867|nr:hypothetical protein [Kitasatospora sp. NBC_01287]MCX4746650.1 hypothetical protein [Kitasatospora sp. NBC_01287]
MDDNIDVDAMREGEEAAKELVDALQLARVVFPSLRGEFPVGDHPLVHLGGASAETARALARWIREHA